MSMYDKEKLDALPEEEIRKRCEERLIKLGAVEWAISLYFFPYKSSLRACKQFLNFPDEKILNGIRNYKLKDKQKD